MANSDDYLSSTHLLVLGGEPVAVRRVTSTRAENQICIVPSEVKKPMRPLPGEVWAIVFDYVGQIGELAFADISDLRLLSVTIKMGLNEWILQGLDRRLRYDGLLRLPPYGPRDMSLQKLAVIALSETPKEVLWCVTGFSPN